MRISSRLSFSLLAGVAAVSMIFSMYQAASEVHTLRDEVQRQAMILAESQQHTVEQILQNGSPDDLQAFVDQFRNHERLTGVGVYTATGKALATTSGMTPSVPGTPSAVNRSLQT